LTFFPLGNADCCRINLESGKQILIDYADMRCADDPNDKRIDLPAKLKKDLAGRNFYDVVAFTHLDDDHVRGSSEFFYWEHAACYQSEDRIRVSELWVPAAAIVEEGLDDCARVIRQEAKHRLRQGEGIRVFSRPELLRGWLNEQGISLESRAHLIHDAGTVIWSKVVDGVEFFIHSPFASRMNGEDVVDRNMDSLVLHGTFTVSGVDTKVLFGADIEHEGLSDVVRITRAKNREERLENDIVKIPHHSSYLSLGPEKGTEKTVPTEQIAYLYEKKLNRSAILVSTSWPVPSNDDDAQPPHRQAKRYYQDCLGHAGEYIVTMEHPSQRNPEPLVIEITGRRGRVKRAMLSSAAIASSSPAPRAGAKCSKQKDS
jgi:hypothetical protein